MDGDNGSSIVGITRELFGDVLLGGITLYGFSVARWFRLFPALEFADGPVTIGVILFFGALIVGYGVQAIGFLVIHRVLFRGSPNWNPPKYLFVFPSESPKVKPRLLRLWWVLSGRAGPFRPVYLAELKKAIDGQFGNGISDDPEQAFRLCWRTAGRYYRSVAEGSSIHGAFGLRNLNLKLCFGAISVSVAFFSAHQFAAFTIAIIAGVFFLRQYVYFDGERARNVYDSFYSWYKETITATVASQKPAAAARVEPSPSANSPAKNE